MLIFSLFLGGGKKPYIFPGDLSRGVPLALLWKKHKPQTTVLTQDADETLLCALDTYRRFWVHQPGEKMSGQASA